MNFEFTEDQRALQDVVRRFVEKEMPKSSVASWDEKGEFPLPLLDKMAAIGLMGASISEEYGGSGGGVMEEVRSVLVEIDPLFTNAPVASLSGFSTSGRVRATLQGLGKRGRSPAVPPFEIGG